MKVVAVLKDKNRYFPSYWKVQEGFNDQGFYDIVIKEAEVENRAPIDENMPILEFFDNIGKKTNKKKISKEISEEFSKKDVKTVKDLINIKLTTPETFSKYFSIKFEIYEELDKLSSKRGGKQFVFSSFHNIKDFFKEEKKKIDYKGRAFKVLRYFHYLQKKNTEIEFLNQEIINEAYDLIRKDFLNEDLMKKIKEFYKPMTVIQKFSTLKLPRGILFYGPPGTGKTTVAEKFPDLIGLTAICTPLSSTELNRSLVGNQFLFYIIF